LSITLSINGHDVEVPDGASVLDAVNTAGVYVPQLCKDPGMMPTGACRTCLAQVEGMRGFLASTSVANWTVSTSMIMCCKAGTPAWRMCGPAGVEVVASPE
jgi:NADH dehydrogenase/NADH:ubiquinone oxidoreductase subunit G